MAHPYDDDNFEEDGCTIDFFDDADATPVRLPPGAVYPEYDGEDFAQYLDDDDDPEPPRDYDWNPDEGPNRASSVPADEGTYTKRRRPKSTAIIREKLGRLLLTSGSRRSTNAPQAPQQNLNRIYDVSFADCKMGNTLVDRSAAVSSAHGSDSGIDSRSGFSLETESDLGVQASSTWRDMEALSARQKPRSSASSVDLRDDYDYNRSEVNRRLDRPEGRLKISETDVNQQRKPSESERATPDGSKSISKTFRKFYNTLSRRKSSNLQPMSCSENIYDEVRL